MFSKLFRWAWTCGSILLAAGLTSCLAQPFAPSETSIIDTDPTEGRDSNDGSRPENSGPGLPGPFDSHGEPSVPFQPPLANAEPSVFSTQIGEGHTPGRPEYLCLVSIYLPLEELVRDHDYRCRASKIKKDDIPPRVLLASRDAGFEFQETYSAVCDLKGWEIYLEIEQIFVYSYTLLAQLPRNLELSVQILRESSWEEVRNFSLSFTCPWPPPESCLNDCETEEPTEPGPSDEPTKPTDGDGD